MRIGGREAVLGFSGEPRRRAPPGAAAGRSLPHRPRLHAIGAVRSARTAQIKRRSVPLRRSTVDRCTGSTGAGPRPGVTACVSPASALRQPGKSQPATWRHHSSPAGRPGNFAKRTLQIPKLQIYPSTYMKSFQPSPFFYA
jgi:hypothetical protein